MSDKGKDTSLVGEELFVLPSYYKAEVVFNGRSSPITTSHDNVLVFRRKIILLVLFVLGLIVIGHVTLGLHLPLRTSNDGALLPKNYSIDEIKQLLEGLQGTTVNNSRSVLKGFNSSAKYIEGMLKKYGYQPIVQHFEIPVPVEGGATFKVSVNDDLAISFPQYYQFQVMPYSASCSGNCTWPLVSILDNRAAQYGCKVATDIPAGSVVLIPYETDRGNCSVYQKAANVKKSGAKAAIFVSGNPNITTPPGPPHTRVFQREDDGTVSYVELLVSIAVSNSTGNQIVNFMNTQSAATNVTLEVSASVITTTTYNIFVETKSGREDKTIIFGAHLDSVAVGPGIDDDGSGSILNLQLAKKLAQDKSTPKNKVRFAWWGAEELGLLGSRYYVSNLSEEAKRNISVYLNFDMVGSPNYMRGVFSAESANNKQKFDRFVAIQKLFTEYFDNAGKTWQLVPFSGNSDFQPFLDADIACGGLYTGAGEIKTDEQFKKFGGIANAAFDPCYHQPCDKLDNVNFDVLEEMIEAAGYTLQKLMNEEDLDKLLSRRRTN